MDLPSKKYYTLGLMSGTSLDGLDICLSTFERVEGKWEHSVILADTVAYSNEQREMLTNAFHASGRELMHIDAQFGCWLGEQVNLFLKNLKHNVAVDVIGSHGHTIFHEPSRGFSTQIGSGAYIAAVTGIPCVSSFRMGDVARGGQGAPLVPIGDQLLFTEYNFCLNLGGFANISFNQNGRRIAFDICPANMAINHLAHLQGNEMDYNGEMGRPGKVNQQLLERLNSIGYYHLTGSKSLGREWFETEFLPVINSFNLAPENKIRTIYEHIAQQIGRVVNSNATGNMLVSGGGAKNQLLVELIRANCNLSVTLPSQQIIDFKEAHIFGFLALLFFTRQNSALASVTGARTDSIAGCLNL